MAEAQNYVYGRGIYKPHPRRPLPQPCGNQGHAWEPPIFDYSHLIGEEYDKKREAILKLTAGDVAKTTEILDKEENRSLMKMYMKYVSNTKNKEEERTTQEFDDGLLEEISRDWIEADQEYTDLGVHLFKNAEGDLKAEDFNEWARKDGSSTVFQQDKNGGNVVVSLRAQLRSMSVVVTTHFEELQYRPVPTPHSGASTGAERSYPNSSHQDEVARIALCHLYTSAATPTPPRPPLRIYTLNAGFVNHPNPSLIQTETTQAKPLAVRLISQRTSIPSVRNLQTPTNDYGVD